MRRRLPVGGPDRVVVADHEEVDVVGRPGIRHDCLGGVIEDGLGVDLEPWPPAPGVGLPVGRPDGVVEPDHKQVDVVGRPRVGYDRLRRVIGDRFRPDLEPGNPVRHVLPEQGSF